MPLRDILGVLRDAYARTVGVEYMHIQEPEQKAWIQEQVEGDTTTPPTVERAAPDPRAAQRGRGVRALPRTRSTWARSGSASKAPRR